MELKHLLVLEAIRKTRTNPPSFLVGSKWQPLATEILELAEAGFLVIGDDKYSISPGGKKTLLLFNSERKDAVKQIGKQSLKRLAYLASRVFKVDDVPNILYETNIFLIWDAFFEKLKEQKPANWQYTLLEDFEKLAREGTDYNFKDIKRRLLDE